MGGHRRVDKVAGDIGKPLGRGQYWAKRALWMSTDTSDTSAALITAGALAACWALAYLLGGAGKVAPHWFYLPVLFAGIRFGPLTALGAGVAAGVLAGPLLPLDVSTHVAQKAPDWGTRAGFFVLIGQVVAFLVARSVGELEVELSRLRICEDLRRGLERDEFALVYQPLVSLSTGEVIGTEALLRWYPNGGLAIPPSQFIPAAEESGLIVPIGAWVLERACRQAAAWTMRLPAGRELHIGVNLSARQLADPGLTDQVKAVLDDAGLAPHVLMLEVTETALVNDIESSVAALTALKALGVRLAIDDFGTGQSSLTYAHRFPVDVMKVDRSFVATIESKATSAAVAAGVVNLAHSLGMTALAEGIETGGQLTLLRSMGCDFGQGFYFDRPGRPEDVSLRLDLLDITGGRNQAIS
jgi:EAL domain-containing protein (putative c-di-GMP-specific phosphodiesterase class I)